MLEIYLHCVVKKKLTLEKNFLQFKMCKTNCKLFERKLLFWSKVFESAFIK